jgi:flagellar biosynthetic protein FliP
LPPPPVAHRLPFGFNMKTRQVIGKAPLLPVIAVVCLVVLCWPGMGFAQTGGSTSPGGQTSPDAGGDPGFTLSLTPTGADGNSSFAVEILLIMTVLSLAPAILIMVTSFTRIVVVMSFLRHALGTQQMPPSQLLIGLALFLTLVVMMPVLNVVNEEALQPYLADEISQKIAYERAKVPLKAFMLGQTREKDISMFVKILGREKPESPEDLGMEIVIPSFVLSELKTAFIMGFVIYIPFVIIDMVVASVLMSMGMLMLPPVMISLPFKILLFVLVDGWNLVVQSLLLSF